MLSTGNQHVAVVRPAGGHRLSRLIQAADRQRELHRILLIQQDAMRKEKLAAEEANQAKSLFLANMSHELRTPMHAILSFANLGRDRVHKVSNEKLQHYFASVANSGERLLALLNNLLDLSVVQRHQVLPGGEHHHGTNLD